jgi:2-polyprenyl-3-methyl-5-hydroxy-6-metoxy-1,4-benzoquinol methylase
MIRKLTPCSISAIDVKESWIEDCQRFFAAKNFTDIKFEVGDLLEISVKEACDLIVCVDVMEHIVEDVKVFQNYYNALKPGGYLLINILQYLGEVKHILTMTKVLLESMQEMAIALKILPVNCLPLDSNHIRQGILMAFGATFIGG